MENFEKCMTEEEKVYSQSELNEIVAVEMKRLLDDVRAEYGVKISVLSLENLCLRCGVAPDYVEDVALLAGRMAENGVGEEEAVLKVIGKYPHFLMVTNINDVRHKRPVFSAAVEKSGVGAGWEKIGNIARRMGIGD